MRLENRQNPTLSALVLLCILVVVALVIFDVGPRLSISFSYWLDELYSTRIIDRSYFEMLIMAGGDVHPPLYYSCLWLWSQFFGVGEAATRNLSVLSSFGTIVILFALKTRISLTSFVFLLFFVLLNPLLYFYAIETRSYALLAFLSALVMVCEIRGWLWATILACVALGSTHYFGSLLALITLGRLAVRNNRADLRLTAAFAAVAILVWPILQMT